MQPQAGANVKQQIIDQIGKSTNILVAVNASPSVDSLAAALGLALILNKLDKHSTAVFSGQIPPAISFLEPNKTFESDVNGLRDFIISLDKEKADRLRYKVEDDVVRVFITPYRTTITQDDLKFSQGDFNVELIIALGVEKRDDLDAAIVAHGRILHDATVVTINANNQQSGLGSIDWHNPNASSLCEMMIDLADQLKKPGLVDGQISTALLTGLVAATDRFSNQHTTPAVMTMAAQMMAAGANQQLVANSLQVGQQPLPEVSKAPEAAKHTGELEIAHVEPVVKQESTIEAAEKELEKALPKSAVAAEPSLDDLKKAIKEEAEAGPSHNFMTEQPQSEAEAEAGVGAVKETKERSWRDRRVEPPTLGSPFTATSEQALTDKNMAEAREQDFKDRVSTLHHGELPAKDDTTQAVEQPKAEQLAEPMPEPVIEPAPSLEPTAEVEAAPNVEPVATEAVATPEPVQPEVQMPVPPAQPTISDLEQSARQDLEAVYANQPFNPANQPRVDLGAQHPLDVQPEPIAQPTVADQPFAAAAAVPAPQFDAPQVPAGNMGTFPPIPPMPQLPVTEPGQLSGGLPPMPPALPEIPAPQTGANLAPPMPPSAFDAPVPEPPKVDDPAQFKIPGQ